MLAEVVVSLDAPDEFLKNRVMNLPESVVAGSHNTEEGLSQLIEWFCIATLCNWLKNFAPLSQPIRIKAKTNRDLVTRVVPRLLPALRIRFEFLLG